MTKTSSANSVLETVQRVLKLEGQAILQCLDRTSRPESVRSLETAIEIFRKTLDTGGKIVVTGVGKSGKIAEKIAATLSSTGSLAVFLHPTEGLHGDLGILRQVDAILALSYTGNTEELIRLLPSIKKLRVPIVGMGGNSDSKLAKESQAWLDVAVEQEACPHNLAPTSSTTLCLAMGDAIAITLMQIRGIPAEIFAQNHPGGSIGKKLHLTVGEIMHRGNSLAILPPSATIDQVIIASTEKKLGGVLITDGEILKGIITDGDLRRALKHREKFFSLKASEVMTARPISCTEDMLAADALKLMEDRSSQISVLPVIDAQGRCKGLLRLHDIVSTF